jgi:hypothetical protein
VSRPERRASTVLRGGVAGDPADRGTDPAGHTTRGDLRERLRRAWSTLREVLWGLALFETYHETKAEAQRHQDAFDLLILGEMLGIPMMNTTVGLRLLPYAVGGLAQFKTRFLQEPEILEQAPHIH